MSSDALSAAEFGPVQDQANGGWGTLSPNYKPETARQRLQRKGEEYRLARHAETLVEERETLGHKTEGKDYVERNGPRLNYRQWMKEP